MHLASLEYCAFRSLEQYTHSKAFSDKRDKQFHLGLLPQPYQGHLSTASVFVLMLNPGLTASANPIGPVTSWQETWRQVLTRPIVATFETLVLGPEVNTDRAYKWILVTGLIGALLQLGLTAVFGAERPIMAILLALVLAPLGAVIALWIEAHLCN